jgi:hypothetical protein
VDDAALAAQPVRARVKLEIVESAYFRQHSEDPTNAAASKITSHLT